MHAQLRQLRRLSLSRRGTGTEPETKEKGESQP